MMNSLYIYLLLFCLPAMAQSQSLATPMTPKETVAAFHMALKNGDIEAVAKTITPDAVIFEGGGVERSFKEYASHHLKADMLFVKNVHRENTKIRDLVSGEMAFVFTDGIAKGFFHEKIINSKFTETMILRQYEKKWKIVHIHWSSSAVKKNHGHKHSINKDGTSNTSKKKSINKKHK